MCGRRPPWSCLPLENGQVVSGGARSRASVREKLFPALKAAGIQYVVNEFSGESSMGNVKKILDLCEGFQPDFIIGTGGGKSIDTAKYAAELYNVPIVTVPTIAATCARPATR